MWYRRYIIHSKKQKLCQQAKSWTDSKTTWKNSKGKEKGNKSFEQIKSNKTQKWPTKQRHTKKTTQNVT